MAGLGYGLAAVTYDPVPTLARFAARDRISYPLLADEGSRIIRAFDLLDAAPPQGSRWYGIAKPMIVALDADGVVTHRFSTEDFRDRPDFDAVMEALGRPVAR